jgi:hypothetical protein
VKVVVVVEVEEVEDTWIMTMHIQTITFADRKLFYIVPKSMLIYVVRFIVF